MASAFAAPGSACHLFVFWVVIEGEGDYWYEPDDSRSDTFLVADRGRHELEDACWVILAATKELAT